ncbi:phosphatase PAP2 family protein [Spongisporangium articulatum]|uniref:Phosphatase PAP2 family protein n=1 Tax=Spongisporangium articulatum TaxID=3362603 RepID=A0ABW8AHZ3_9ACTN
MTGSVRARWTAVVLCLLLAVGGLAVLLRERGTGPVAEPDRPVTPAATATTTAAGTPRETGRPDLLQLLAGYRDFWAPRGDLRGTVRNATVLGRDDRLAVWINQHATGQQRFLALQDAEYQNPDGTAYDQSVTIATGLGSRLGPLYVKGRTSGALPLTSALVDNSDGTAGDYVDTTAAKAAFSHPRPSVPTDPDTPRVAGDAQACAPSRTNAASLRGIRVGRAWADRDGNLKITRVPPVIDTTHHFSRRDVPLDGHYGRAGLCTGGSFPSGHTTSAYQAGLTLATLLPELAPEILARTSEAGNNRIVLGVHYPLDVMGGRIAGEAAVAARWADPSFRRKVLRPARAELVAYLERTCGHPLVECIAAQRPYASDPYGGRVMPGGTAQVVTDRRSAVAVYRERLTYGFDPVGDPDRAPSVPPPAADLLRTAFPTLTGRQRADVLAQTQLPSGYPLDRSTAPGSWQRLDLAAAMSATVRLAKDGSAQVVSTGGPAVVVE